MNHTLEVPVSVPSLVRVQKDSCFSLLNIYRVFPPLSTQEADISNTVAWKSNLGSCLKPKKPEGSCIHHTQVQ